MKPEQLTRGNEIQEEINSLKVRLKHIEEKPYGITISIAVQSFSLEYGMNNMLEIEKEFIGEAWELLKNKYQLKIEQLEEIFEEL